MSLSPHIGSSLKLSSACVVNSEQSRLSHSWITIISAISITMDYYYHISNHYFSAPTALNVNRVSHKVKQRSVIRMIIRS
eukprot:4477527-Amphidinium_carterae.1